MTRGTKLAPLFALFGTLFVAAQIALPQSPPPPPASVVINEVLVDPAAGPAGDANGDGVRDTYQDEFIELVNRGYEPVDISGWLLEPAGSNAFTFPGGTTLPPGAYIVVFGGGAPTALPGPALTAGGRIGSGLSNASGRLLLIDPAGPDTLQDISYQNWDTDASFSRDPEGWGAFTDHSVRFGRPFSPAAPATESGGPFQDAPALYRVRVVNLTSAGFQVAWRTASVADGRLEITLQGTLRHYFDPLPAGVLHLAGRYGLSPQTAVTWRVVSSGSRLPADSTFSATTGPVITSVPYTVYGRLAGGGGPVERGQIFVRARRGTNPSGWLLAETDSSGRWDLNLGNLRMPDGGGFAWAGGDTLLIEADAGSVGVASATAVISGTSPQEVVLPALQPDPPPLFAWTLFPTGGSADTTLFLRYSLSDPGEAWARPYLRRQGQTDLYYPESEPPLLVPDPDAGVTLRLDGLPEASVWWIGALVEDGLNPPQQVEAPVPIRIAHTIGRAWAYVAGVTLFTPTLDDPAMQTASAWLATLRGSGELARWDEATGAWSSLARQADGTLIGNDFGLQIGAGYALVSALPGTVMVSGPRRYGPPLLSAPPGLALVGIADSLNVRPASLVFGDPHVRAVSRWDPYRQAWQGRFRIPDGSQLGEDFAIGWGEAVAVESDSVVPWQPSVGYRRPLPPARAAFGKGAGSAGVAGSGVLFASPGGPGAVSLIWRSPPGGTLRLEFEDGTTFWRAQPHEPGVWRREEVTGLGAGPYRVVLEAPGAGGVVRLLQRVEVAAPAPPRWPVWAWGPAPVDAGPLILRGSEGALPVTGLSGGRWYADLSHPALGGGDPKELIELAPDGGWSRWRLRAPERGAGPVRLEPDGEATTLTGLQITPVGPLALLLSWRVAGAPSALSFRPWLGFEGRGGGGPRGDPRQWTPAGEETRWAPGDAGSLYRTVRLDSIPAGAAGPEAVALQVRFADGRLAWLGPVAMEVPEEATGIALMPAAPNPFNPETLLRYSLPAGGPYRVRLTIHDVRGRRVRSLVDALRPSGMHRVRWDGRDDGRRRVASGIYLVVLEVEGRRQSRKILLLK